jgi:DMSO/TMAO reductase YedYZ molybdopterin-dependent catalytic subunit
MAGRRTNLALLGLLVLAFATGALAYSIGTGWSRWIAVAHGVAGFAIIVLSPWKSVIARRGLRRSRPGNRASVVLTALTATVLLFGLSHSTGVARSIGGLTAMQIHVGAALFVLPLAIWHTRVRRVRFHRTDVSRRQLLRAGAFTGAAAFVYLGIEGAVRIAGLPGAGRGDTGSFERGSNSPDQMPVTQWLNDRVPEVDLAAWRLRVRSDEGNGLITYEDLLSYEDRVRAVLDCTGGWFAEQDWEGVWLEHLLADAGFKMSGRSIGVASVTGFGRRFPLGDARRVLLATRAGGQGLSAGHGFPLRVVAPGRRGFWWVKWVTEISLSEVPWWRQPPFPLT